MVMRLTIPHRPVGRAVLVAALLMGAGVAPSRAADARFQRVTLLPAGERVSLVFELSGEPRNVATRRVSAAVLELDAGPVSMPVRTASFVAPSGVRFVLGVTVQGAEASDGGVLKARITLVERAHSAVRVVGRRVYVDFSAEPEPPRLQQLERRPAARPAAPTSAPAPVPATHEPSAPPAAEVYRAAVQPAVDRLEQLKPFLLSATVSPSEPVLKAVGSTLAGIQGLLLSLDVPRETQAEHDLLSSAVAAAVTAVDPSFSGDRASQLRQALSLFDKAKSGL